MRISKEISVEDLVELYPFSVQFMAEKGIRCIACGEPIWGTLEEACREKAMDDNQINEIITALNTLSKNN